MNRHQVGYLLHQVDARGRQQESRSDPKILPFLVLLNDLHSLTKKLHVQFQFLGINI